MNGSQAALALTLIAFGFLVVIGSVGGTLAPALAGLFDPSILGTSTASNSGGSTNATSGVTDEIVKSLLDPGYLLGKATGGKL